MTLQTSKLLHRVAVLLMHQRQQCIHSAIQNKKMTRECIARGAVRYAWRDIQPYSLHFGRPDNSHCLHIGTNTAWGDLARLQLQEQVLTQEVQGPIRQMKGQGTCRRLYRVKRQSFRECKQTHNKN